jgi:DUF4097 and DUF4098 domain-containing protein YvlB
VRLGSLFLIAVGAASVASAQQPAVRREGKAWVRSGQIAPFTLPPQIRRLELVTRGHVVLRGTDGDQLQVKMQQRVGTNTIEEANREWGVYERFNTPVEAARDWIRLTVQPPATMRVSTDLEITVPRRLAAILIRNQLGRVEVYDLDGSVQAFTDFGGIQVDRIHGDFQGQTSTGDIRMGSIGGSVRCSTGGGAVSVTKAGGETNCHTAGGDIAVGQAGGLLTVTTEGGNIRVDQAADAVHARSVEGLIEVGQAKGTVYADTRGGAIQVGSANGVKAESAAGMVRVKGASGPMTLSTMMGSILAELMQGARLQDSSLAASAGDITVLIPAGVGLSIRARTESGMTPRIVSDFPEIQVNAVGFRSPIKGQGSINGGGPVLNLNTSGGVIYLRKAK